MLTLRIGGSKDRRGSLVFITDYQHSSSHGCAAARNFFIHPNVLKSDFLFYFWQVRFAYWISFNHIITPLLMYKTLLPLFFFALVLLSSCKEKEDTAVKGSDATLKTITLGAENFNLTVPEAGATVTLNNAPRTIQSVITAVPVNITAADNVAISKGGTAFTSGAAVDFTHPVTFTVTAPDGTAKNYTVAITAYDASGNPYGVYTVKHLTAVRNALDKSYKLMNNLSLPAANAEGVTATGISDYATAGWLPIANDAVFGTKEDKTVEIKGGFAGIFDGGGNSITNFFINRTKICAGLFAVTQTTPATATIKNLTVNGITGSTSISSTEDDGTYGMLVGIVGAGSIDNCSVSGTITVTCKATAGGLVGLNASGSISHCSSSVIVLSTSKNHTIGGLIAHTLKDSHVSNCYATGNVSCTATDRADYTNGAGGLIGYNSGMLSNCYATGNVSSPATKSVGGLIGFNHNLSITDCYATGSVTGGGKTSFVGGLLGYCESDCDIKTCYATGNVFSKNSINGPLVGGLIGGVSDSKVSSCYATGSVDADCNSGATRGTRAGGLMGACYSNTVSNCFALGNVSVTESSDKETLCGGLFGFLGGAGRIPRVISNCYASGNISVSSTGTMKAGRIAGDIGNNSPTITNCHSSATIRKSNEVATPSDD